MNMYLSPARRLGSINMISDKVLDLIDDYTF